MTAQGAREGRAASWPYRNICYCGSGASQKWISLAHSGALSPPHGTAWDHAICAHPHSACGLSPPPGQIDSELRFIILQPGKGDALGRLRLMIEPSHKSGLDIRQNGYYTVLGIFF